MARLARDFHDGTKHSVRSVMLGTRQLDWANRPLAFKLYPDLEPLPLPRTWREPEIRAAEVLAGRTSPGGVDLDLAVLARLLFLTGGVTRRLRRGPDTVFFRAAPSAGALYPVELYVACGGLRELPAGLYHFEPVEFVLRCLREGDVRGHLAHAAADRETARTPVSLVMTGIPWRTTWKYGARGYRHLFWDAGTMLANALAAAASGGLACRVLTGFVDASLTRILGLDAVDRFEEYPLVVVPLGPPAATEAVAGALPRLELAVAPLSDEVVEEPDLQAVHRAGDLEHPEAVADWRRRLRALGSAPAAGEPSVPTGASATIDEVVLRRGSTRRFDPERAVPAAALGWGLAVAARLPVRDTAPAGGGLLTHFLSVHAVEGVQPGAYRWGPAGAEPYRAGDFRRQAAHLCLDQALGGTSAFTAFHCAWLGPLLEAGGARAYRAVQLEAGIAAGRLQLTAFTLGLGATGLTFYDDQVSAFFDTAAEPMLVTAVGVPAYDSTPGRPPSELEPLVLDAERLRR